MLFWQGLIQDISYKLCFSLNIPINIIGIFSSQQQVKELKRCMPGIFKQLKLI